MCLIRMSVGTTWWVSVAITSRRLSRKSMVTSIVSFGMGTRIRFRRLLVVVLASGYVSHSWNKVEKELR